MIDTFHSLEDRQMTLNSSVDYLNRLKEIVAKLNRSLGRAQTDCVKKELTEKLGKYQARIKDAEFSVKLAQRDYDAKVQRMKDEQELVIRMINRSRQF